ncbi:MAG: hypothetical protein ACKVQK_03690 [Burkholderiales bacterium]
MEAQWWGHSKVHGWVVLDRTIANNEPGHKDNLMFFRCKDSMTYIEKRKNWNPPSYTFAPNYIKTLSPELAVEATAAFEAVQAHWPEYQAQMQKELFEVERREAADRDFLDKQQKDAAKEALKEKKKLAAAAKAEKPAAA